MAQLMAQTLNCGQINTSSKVGQYVARVGAPSICRRGIVRDKVLIGYISLSYPAEPTEDEIKRVNALIDIVESSIVR